MFFFYICIFIISLYVYAYIHANIHICMHTFIQSLLLNIQGELVLGLPPKVGRSMIGKGSSSMYNMVWYLHLIYTHSPIFFKSSYKTWYLIQCPHFTSFTWIQHSTVQVANINIWLLEISGIIFSEYFWFTVGCIQRWAAWR
jgi:hypothetical protein